jgi:hypothetical protein
MERITLSLKRKTIEIEIEDEDGSQKIFKVMELSGNQRDEYLNTSAKRMSYDAQGKPSGVKDFRGMHTDLLIRSVYDENGELVKGAILETWPSTTIERLFEISQELSGLDAEKIEDESKND